MPPDLWFLMYSSRQMLTASGPSPFYRIRNWDSREHCSMILTSAHHPSLHCCWRQALH